MQKVTDQIEQVLFNGGEFTFEYDKKKFVVVSVHTSDNHLSSKFKYHYRNGYGNRVFIKTNKREIAQKVCDILSGQHGKYTISSSYV